MTRYEACNTIATQHKHSPGRSLPIPATLTSSPHSVHTSHRRALLHSPHLHRQRSPSRHQHQIRRHSRISSSRTPRQRRTLPTNSPTFKIFNSTSQNNTPSCAPNSTNFRPTPHSPLPPPSNAKQSSKRGRPSTSVLRSGKLSHNSRLSSRVTHVL